MHGATMKMFLSTPQCRRKDLVFPDIHEIPFS
jgi:hypothetical protein